MRLKSLLFLLIFPLLSISATPPDEGMWLLNQIDRLNQDELGKMGLELTPEEIYSINNSSLKDAIVRLGQGFCSAEIVSSKGLVFTNHHCAYDLIQSHSSVENDYLTDGFWAMKQKDELPNPGLTASILVRIEDVTERVMKAVKKGKKKDKEKIINEQIQEISGEAAEDGKYDTQVKAFYEGNEYYLLVYQTFRDIRLVGAPPSSIGKYGGDTDNWMWTRHTGDFAVLRIYTDKDNNPADYSEDNVPYTPKHHLPVSIKGVKEKDYAMTIGFPGSTDRYLSSYGVKHAIELDQPTRVKVRGKKLDILKKHMNADDAVRIKYASKYSGISNYWKYFIGQTKGLKNLNVIAKKQKEEKDFSNWLKKNKKANKKYSKTINNWKEGYAILERSQITNVHLYEAFFGIEAISFSYPLTRLEGSLGSASDEEIKGMTEGMKAQAEAHFKDYDADTDKEMMAAMLEMYYNNADKKAIPSDMSKAAKKYKGNWKKYANKAFSKSILTDKGRYMAFMDNPSKKALKKDPIYNLMNNTLAAYRKHISPSRTEAFGLLDEANTMYVAGVREMNSNKAYYPNANSTPRLSYGQVMSYVPRDAVNYKYYTTANGILEKEDPNNDEFIVHPKLKKLIKEKNFGRYGENDQLRVNFISNNDITGGNSGSAVMNGKGELIGIAFDGNWEAMSGDIAFEPSLQRTISVDIRYVLFVIDKFAGCKRLIEEMDLVD